MVFFQTAALAEGTTGGAGVDLTPLLQAVVSLAVSLITALLIPWLRARYSSEQLRRVQAVYQTCVYAAEQLFGAGAGERKLQWVQDQLSAKGFTFDRAAVEAEVRKMASLGASLAANEQS
jgi:hypothetical protein